VAAALADQGAELVKARAEVIKAEKVLMRG
jgi:hypothetical protein